MSIDNSHHQDSVLTQPSVLATVHDIQHLSGDVHVLRLKPSTSYPHLAGQYTELLIKGFESLYFSIASPPQAQFIELHIQGGLPTNEQLIQHLTQIDEINIAPAAGNCIVEKLPPHDGPLLLIASGTGFSQIKAIVEDNLHKQTTRPIYLYWSSYKLSQLYMQEKVEVWAQQHEHLHTTLLVSEHSHWQDKHQQLVHSILGDHDDLGCCQAVACGSPEMVYTLYDTLCEQGFPANGMISDMFDFAPRK